MAVWTVIAAGPLTLGVAVLSGPTTVAAAPSAKPTALRAAAAPADPGWQRSSANEATSAQTRLAHSMAPDIELPDPAPSAQPALQSVTAVRSAQRSAGTWSVTVAAQHADQSVRYYTVPVAYDSTGSSFTVTASSA
ncbi:hypothetical protein ACWDCB_40185 [Streptomyces sp. NPDC001178]